MANPYTVVPGGDYGPGLAGLGQTMMQIGERKKEEEAIQLQKDKMAAAQAAVSDAWESQDPEKIRNAMVQYPEISKGIKKAMDMKFPGQSGTKLKDAYFRAAVDFSQAPTILEEMREQFAVDGIDQQEQAKLDEFQTLIDTDPEAAKKEIETGLAVMTMDDKEVWDRYQDLKGTVEESDKYEGITPKLEEFLRINKLEPTSENYKLFNKQEKKLKKELKDNTDKYPLTSELAAKGWMPSGRITGPQMDFLESAARRAKDLGIPLTPEKLRDMEFQAQKNKSTGAAAGSRLVIARKQNIEAAVGILKDLKVTSEKLDYSPVKFIGALEKFKKGQLGDPIFTEYMAQRADSLFILGNALKQNGLTDKSIEVEEEAFSPTLSPAQFNAWYNTQLRALNRAATEMNADYKFGLSTSPAFPAGQAGAPTKEDPTPTTQDHVREPIDAVQPTPQAEIEAMSPGEIFIGPDGKEYRRN